MAKKGKIKISKVKRNNHMTNKLKKAGKLKLKRHKEKLQKQKQPMQTQVEYSDSDSASGDEWADMLDEEEQQYIMKRLTKQPGLLQNVPMDEDTTSKKSKKRKRGREPKLKINSDSGAESETESDVEGKYEKELAERPAKKQKPLLPIKTKDGVIEQMEECEESESEPEESKKDTEPKKSEDEHSDSDSGMETWEGGGDENESSEGVITSVQLVAARRDRLNHEKLRIGALCSSLLESPEKKLKNLYPILYLMEERLKDDTLNLHSVRKLASLSAFEVFKDILPEYHIRHQDYSNIKLKKETLALYKYEKELLEFYKRYLQRLEKAATVLRPKKGDNSKTDEPTVSLALVSLSCMCGLLTARPHFNFAINIAQSIVPFLDCKNAAARDIASQCCCTLFKEDTKGEITLTVVRLINQLVKRRGERLKPSALDCLLSLKIKDVNLDAETNLKYKKKQDEKHKKRIVNLSKKEKKRMKKLKEVERELLETEAHENEMSRHKKFTEVTKIVFHIYFRLLKNEPRSELLAAVLNGIVKWAHVINVELYSSLAAALARLAASGVARLQCTRAALAVLAAAGGAIALDPAVFHCALYGDMLAVHAGVSQQDAKIVIEAVSQMCARARSVSAGVLQAFAKRLATLAAQVAHHGALACLLLLHQLSVNSKEVAALLDGDTEAAGSGRFDPSLESPEHCNAHAARLHELCVLRRHYHPTTRETAAALLRRTSLPPALHKLSPNNVYDQYDGSQMAFKPSIPPPRPTAAIKSNTNRTLTSTNNIKISQKQLQEQCDRVEKEVKMQCDFSNCFNIE